MSELHEIAHSTSRDIDTHSRNFLSTFVINKCNSYRMIVSRKNIVGSQIAVDITFEMESRELRAELAQDGMAQPHLDAVRWIHPSRQHEARGLAGDDHFLARVAILADEKNLRHSKIVAPEIFRDSPYVLGTLRTRFCFR